MGRIDERHVTLLVDHDLMLTLGIYYLGRQRRPVRATMSLSRQHGLPARFHNNLNDGLAVSRHIHGSNVCFHGAPPTMHDQRIVSNILERFVRQPGTFQAGGHNYERHLAFSWSTLKTSTREPVTRQLPSPRSRSL